jgi:choline kinase
VRSLSGAIIAAGRGERLRPAVGGLPKPLVEVGGEILLMRQVQAMLALGLRPVHVIVNSETAQIMAARSINVPAAVDIIVRDTPNSMESLLTLGERLAPGRFVLATVDVVIERGEFSRFVERACELTDPERLAQYDGAMGVVKWRGDRHPLFANVAADGLITALNRHETDFVTAGVYLFSTRIFDHAADARIHGLDAMRRFLALLIEAGMKFAAVELEGVIDVDEGADLDAARTLADSGPCCLRRDV